MFMHDGDPGQGPGPGARLGSMLRAPCALRRNVGRREAVYVLPVFVDGLARELPGTCQLCPRLSRMRRILMAGATSVPILIALQMRSSVPMWSNLFGEDGLIGETGVTGTLDRASSCKVTCHGLSRATLSARAAGESPHPQNQIEQWQKAPMQTSLEPGGRVGGGGRVDGIVCW